jgi:hypothetical protein
MLPFEVWREAFINDADIALATSAYGALNPHPYKTFTDKIKLSQPLARHANRKNPMSIASRISRCRTATLGIRACRNGSDYFA